MLNRLFLVIHWLMFITFCLHWAVFIWVRYTNGFATDDVLSSLMATIFWSNSAYSNYYFTGLGLHFPVLFLLVNFIVLGKWTWFPWQRNKD